MWQFLVTTVAIKKGYLILGGAAVTGLGVLIGRETKGDAAPAGWLAARKAKRQEAERETLKQWVLEGVSESLKAHGVVGRTGQAPAEPKPVIIQST